MKLKSTVPVILGRIAYLAGLFNIFSNSLKHFNPRAAEIGNYSPRFNSLHRICNPNLHRCRYGYLGSWADSP
jgi:hypothetical protein